MVDVHLLLYIFMMDVLPSRVGYIMVQPSLVCQCCQVKLCEYIGEIGIVGFCLEVAIFVSRSGSVYYK